MRTPNGLGRSVMRVSVRVLLVDDHEVVRRGLRDLLDTEEDLDIVAEAGGVDEAVVRAQAGEPDVAVVDMRLPDGDGIQLCRRLRALSVPPYCLILTAFDDEQALLDAINAGASGYLLKQIRGRDLVHAVREVALGRSLLASAMTERMMSRLRENSPSAVDELATLTERERRVLELIGEGMTNRQIAERLFLAEKTVKNHVTSILAKLKLERRTQAVAWVARQDR